MEFDGAFSLCWMAATLVSCCWSCSCITHHLQFSWAPGFWSSCTFDLSLLLLPRVWGVQGELRAVAISDHAPAIILWLTGFKSCLYPMAVIAILSRYHHIWLGSFLQVGECITIHFLILDTSDFKHPLLFYIWCVCVCVVGRVLSNEVILLAE